MNGSVDRQPAELRNCENEFEVTLHMSRITRIQPKKKEINKISLPKIQNLGSGNAYTFVFILKRTESPVRMSFGQHFQAFLRTALVSVFAECSSMQTAFLFAKANLQWH